MCSGLNRESLWLGAAVPVLASAYSCPSSWGWLAAVAGVACFSAGTRRERALSALGAATVVGVFVSGAALHWLPSALSRSSGCSLVVAVVLTVFAVLVYAIRYAVAGWSEHRATRNGWPRGLGLLLGFATGELLVPGPMPWYLGNCAHDALILMQTSAVAGPIGVSFVVVTMGLLLESIAKRLLQKALHHADVGEVDNTGRASAGSRLTPWLVFVSIPVAYGYWRLSESDSSRSSSSTFLVGIVQANVPPASTRGNAEAGIAAIRQHIVSTRTLRARGADLVVWPETAAPVAVPFERARDLYPRLFTRTLQVPAVIGAALLTDSSGFYNSALSINRDGGVEGIYLKRRLAPFGEQVPGAHWVPQLRRVFPEAREAPGPDEAEKLSTLQRRVSVFICFEALFPKLVRDSISRDRSELLLALVNDAWFGDTWEPRMHFAAAKFRAVESGRYLVRAATSGISGVVDPWGRVIVLSEPVSRAELLGSFSFRSSVTTYTRIGDAPWWIATLALVYVSLKRYG